METPSSQTDTIIIAPDKYPLMLSGDQAKNFLQILNRPETAQRAGRVIELRRADLSEAVGLYIRQLESENRAANVSGVFAQAHELRGLAGTVGLETVGRIADGLCKYIDTCQRMNGNADPVVIALHVDAIGRVSAPSSDAKLGSRIVVELGALVAHKLDAVNALQTKAG